MTSVLITGANRGLGLEMARQYAADGWRVYGCCRKPDAADELRALAAQHNGAVSVHPLDVESDQTIEALGGELDDQPVDVLINNAAINPGTGTLLPTLSFEAWERCFRVNTIGPVNVSQRLLENVLRSERRLIVMISSNMGSIELNDGGHAYEYRTSKAALNAATKNMAIELKDRGVTVVAIHPGWVKTRMGGDKAPLDATDSISQVRRVLDGLTIMHTGQLISYTGEVLPW